MTQATSLSACNWVSPPGRTLLDFMERKQLSLEETSSRLNMPIHFLSMFLKGEKSLNVNLAKDLAQFTGASENFWLTREKQFRERIATLEKKKFIEESEWASKFSYPNLASLGWLPKTRTVKDKINHLKSYFELNCIDDWNRKYGNLLSEAAFRISSSYVQSSESVSAWLRQGEIQTSEMTVANWNSDILRASLSDIRSLTAINKPQNFLPPLKEMLSASGVRLAIAPTPKNCPASGATYWVTPNKPLLILSFRFLTDDQFWFTLFHEIGHLILHSDYRLILESNEDGLTAMEREANEFAQNVLIPQEFYEDFLSLDHKNLRAILRFSKKIGVSKGIVVGQLQHHNIIKPYQLNKLKTRYSKLDCY